MPTLNPHAEHLINEYIARQSEFAREIATQIRTILHKAAPTMKEDWKGHPSFYCNGDVCTLTADPEGVMLTFINGESMKDPCKLFDTTNNSSPFRTILFTQKDAINEHHLIDYVQKAIAINTDRVTSTPANNEKDRDFKTDVLPAYIRDEFARHGLSDKFNAFPYSHRREYVQWIESAKKEATKQKRLHEALLRISLGKGWYTSDL